MLIRFAGSNVSSDIVLLLLFSTKYISSNIANERNCALCMLHVACCYKECYKPIIASRYPHATMTTHFFGALKTAFHNLTVSGIMPGLREGISLFITLPYPVFLSIFA